MHLFEPNIENIPCLNANLVSYPNWQLHLTALGDYTGEIDFIAKGGNSVLAG